MFFIYNPRLVSQAGRRGFESLLPLHLFNTLRGIVFLQKPTFEVTRYADVQNQLKGIGLKD